MFASYIIFVLILYVIIISSFVELPKDLFAAVGIRLIKSQAVVA